MEEAIKDVLKIDDFWNKDKTRKYVWGRMFYIYLSYYVYNKKDISLINNKLTHNQYYYLIYKSMYNMKKNHYFRYYYLMILDKLIQKSF